MPSILSTPSVVPLWRRKWFFHRAYWQLLPSWHGRIQIGLGWQTDFTEHHISVVIFPFLGRWHSEILFTGARGRFITGRSHGSAAQAMRYTREYIQLELNSRGKEL